MAWPRSFLLLPRERECGRTYGPYLCQSLSPRGGSSRHCRVGLSRDHNARDLYLAVLEGTAFEAEYMRCKAENSTGIPIDAITVFGGGSKNRDWMQIKANVFGRRIEVLDQGEMPLLGAAFLGGVGAGAYRDIDELKEVGKSTLGTIHYEPDMKRHQVHKQRFETLWLAVQEPLRDLYSVK